MTEHSVDPLPPGPDPSELELTQALESHRPVPNAGFRGALSRHLLVLDPGYGPRDRRGSASR